MHLVQVVFLQKQMRGKYTAMVVWRRQTVLRPPARRRSGLIKSLSIDITLYGVNRISMPLPFRPRAKDTALSSDGDTVED